MVAKGRERHQERERERARNNVERKKSVLKGTNYMVPIRNY